MEFQLTTHNIRELRGGPLTIGNSSTSLGYADLQAAQGGFHGWFSKRLVRILCFRLRLKKHSCKGWRKQVKKEVPVKVVHFYAFC